MIAADEFRARISQLRLWRRKGERAPHKPLLLLLALGHLLRGEDRMRPYGDIAAELEVLLKRFGPPRIRQAPEQPILRLHKDGLWVLENFVPEDHLDRGGNPRHSVLKNSDVRCGLPLDVHQLLAAKPELRLWAIRYLLDSHFPESYHQDIVKAVTLREIGELQLSLFESDQEETRRRDPKFRPRVIRAYEFRCAICDYDIHIDGQPLGLEAAHIRWHANGGPDHVRNGLALCVVHHKAFDRGGISLRDDLRLLVSSGMHGRNEAWDYWFRRHMDHPIRAPRRSDHLPDPRHLQWHRRQVFQGDI